MIRDELHDSCGLFIILLLEQLKFINMKLFEMKSFLVKVFIVIAMLSPLSCDDIFQYNPNEVLLHDDEKNLNQQNIDKIQAIPYTDTLSIIVIADPHHDYENLEDFVSMANNLSGISFIAIAGDFTTFGLQTEYREIYQILKDLNIPYVAVVGNHDLLGNGEKVYKEMFGNMDFEFTCNNHKFICINSNSREYEFNEKIPDLNWMENELNDPNTYDGIFILSHIAPFHSDFDPALEDRYATALSGSGRVKLSMHGHAHDFYFTDHYDDGVEYLVTDDIKDRNYSLIKIWNNSYSVEQKPF